MTSNKLAKMVNGNRRLGYHLGIWNCRKGLIKDKEVSTKMVDVKNFIYSKKLHMFCLVESDLHGQASRHRRTQPLTTADIHTQLAIPGYKIYLPSTWDKHGQARLIVYAKEELQVKEINTTGDSVSDLPTITFLISLGKERKTAVNFFYREHTGGVSGLNDIHAQNDRLFRQINHWRTLCKSKHDFISLGDCNLDYNRWYDEDYHLHDQVAMVQSFLLDTTSSQIVKTFTRSEIVQGGALSRSCIDHCYSNTPEKLLRPEVLAVGESDHIGTTVTKYSRAEPIKPKTVQKRSYKKFDIEQFLTDVHDSSINNDVTACDNIEEASAVFEKGFKHILDKHAPIKVFQNRKHYCPYVSERTKTLMCERNNLKEKAAIHGDKNSEIEFKRKGKEIKKALIEDEKLYYMKDFSVNNELSATWRTAKTVLGENVNLSPTAIKNTSESGEVEVVTSPKKLANIFNKFF